MICKSFIMFAATVAAIAATSAETTHDIVIYGSSPAAISAAVQAKRMGKSAVIVSPETRIGGLTTGGLGQTDIGNKKAFGGIALEFYRDVAKWYADAAHWTRQTPAEYKPDGQCSGTKGAESMWTFEPSAALAILEGWEKRDGLDIRRGEWLDRAKGVVKRGGRIVSIKTLSGNVYRGKVFIDATYEGDLMAAAGVSYAVGREANSVYGETISGIQFREAKSHQLQRYVSPYVVEGKPESGLLPGIEPRNPNEKDGDGDKRVQAYNFRMCLTDDPANRIPFKKPANYDEREYELLFRNFAKGVTSIPLINSRMPNRKTDTNNRGGFSTDFIGRNWEWPEASYERRREIFKAHLDYQRGLMWTLANHPRVPEKVREYVSRWGTCKDEFLDGPGDGWQSQLYVREARRMVGDYVMTEHECRGDRTAPHPVAMGAYTMDSHNVRRYVTAKGNTQNEGDVQDHFRYSAWGKDAKKRAKGGRMKPYGIDYGAICPKRGECENLLVPVCLSASHIAFGSIRMEPVFFALGQAAGTAASLAAGGRSSSTAAARGDTRPPVIAVQDVPYDALAARLVADGQVIPAAPKEKHLEDAASLPAAKPASGLPEILLIGDSIRIGYCRAVAEALAGKAEVRWPKENCRNSQHILTALAAWRGLVASPKVVQFNCGHWDVSHFDGDEQPLTSVEEYGRNVRKIIHRIRRYWPEAKIVFATTTPMNPGGTSGRNVRTTEEIRRYNAEAVKVAKSEGVEVNDLFAVAEKWPASDYSDYCHFSRPAAARLGNIVASRLSAWAVSEKER